MVQLAYYYFLYYLYIINFTKTSTIMKYLSNYMEEQQTEAFNSHGAFFAFSKEQYDKAAKKGVKYLNLGSGLICPESKAESLVSALEQIHDQAIQKDFEENGAESIIEREYFNYEQQIAYDDLDFNSALKPYQNKFPNAFTDTIIKNVRRKCWDKAVKNDWF